MLPTVGDLLGLDVIRRGSPQVVAGSAGLGARVRWVHVLELADAAHLLQGGELVLTGFVPDADLVDLYNLARVFVFPSWHEGFGLPVLEAMARAVPVACSEIAVLREVGGELPHYFDPGDPAAAAAAIAAAMSTEDAGRGEAGVNHAARFSWAESARGTMAAYERALSGARK